MIQNPSSAMEVKTCSVRRLCGVSGTLFHVRAFLFLKSAHIWGRKVSVKMSVHIRSQPLASLPCRAQPVYLSPFMLSSQGSPRGCPHISHIQPGLQSCPPTPSETHKTQQQTGFKHFLGFHLQCQCQPQHKWLLAETGPPAPES